MPPLPPLPPVPPTPGAPGDPFDPFAAAATFDFTATSDIVTLPPSKTRPPPTTVRGRFSPASSVARPPSMLRPWNNTDRVDVALVSTMSNTRLDWFAVMTEVVSPWPMIEMSLFDNVEVFFEDELSAARREFSRVNQVKDVRGVNRV